MSSYEDTRRAEFLTALSLSVVDARNLSNTDLYRRNLASAAGMTLEQAAKLSEADLGGKYRGRFAKVRGVFDRPSASDPRGVTTKFHGVWRTMDNTGCPKPKSELTPSGAMVITTAGTVVENMYIRGGLQVNAPDVTVRNCIIDYQDYFAEGGRYGVHVVHDGTGKTRDFSTVIEDTTILGTYTAIGTPLCFYVERGSTRVSRVYAVNSGGDIAKCNGPNITVEDSILAGPQTNPGGHVDCIQTLGATNYFILRCRIEGTSLIQNPKAADSTKWGQGSPVFISTEASANDNVQFRGNYCEGSNSYLVNGDYNNTGAPNNGTNYYFTDNRFGARTQLGEMNTKLRSGPATVEYKNNVKHISGAEVVQ